MLNTEKSKSVQAFLDETISMSKQLGNIRVNELRKAIAKSKGFATAKSYLDHLESQDKQAAINSNNINLSETPTYLGRIYLPTELARLLASDEFEEEDFEDIVSSIDLDGWLNSISGLSNSLKFTVIKSEQHDFRYLKTADITTFCDSSTDSISEVIVTGCLSTPDAIKIDYALRPELFEVRYKAFLAQIVGNDTPPMGMFAQAQWERIQEAFKQLPDEFNFEAFWKLLENDMIMMALFFSLSVK